jgi:non-ribosomal peptide synthase protein (TIGR01720 family)
VLAGVGEEGEREAGERLKETKERLRRIPNRGFGYGVLRYAGEKEVRECLTGKGEAELSFNYLGQFDQTLKGSKLFAAARESSGTMTAAENRRRHLVDVNGMVVEGKLRMNWSYSREVHKRETVERIAQRYLECLRGLIEHCRSEEAGGYTPSDFPLAKMSQKKLSKLAAMLNN